MTRSGLRAWTSILLKLATVLLLPAAGSGAAAASYALLALWALRGPRSAIEALTLCWLATHANPGLYAAPPAAELLRLAVVGMAFVSVSLATLRAGLRVPPVLLPLLAFSGVAVGLAPFSDQTALALVRLTIFTLGAVTVLLAFHLSRDRLREWQAWFLRTFTIVVLLGLPLIALDLGYLRNGRGFQGLLYHPQVYGTYLAPHLAWLLVLRLEGRVLGRMVWPVILAAAVSLFASQTRTGVFAALLGLLAALAWSYLRRPGYLPFTRRRLLQSLPVLLAVGIALLLQGGTIRDGIWQFAVKYGGEESLSESLQWSRGRLALRSFQGFLDHPFTGIGFGLPSEPEKHDIRRDPVLGLPMGTTSRVAGFIPEKGVTPIAVLEEVGLPGFLLYVALLLSLLRPVVRRRGSVAPLALAATTLSLTLGEAVFFTTSGTGLLIWLLLALARIDDPARRVP